MRVLYQEQKIVLFAFLCALLYSFLSRDHLFFLFLHAHDSSQSPLDLHDLYLSKGFPGSSVGK